MKYIYTYIHTYIYTHTHTISHSIFCTVIKSKKKRRCMQVTHMEKRNAHQILARIPEWMRQLGKLGDMGRYYYYLYFQ
jgi:hypothetical protein